MIRLIAEWLNIRVRGSKFLRNAINHVFPDHWSFMLGEIALYCFVVLTLTGIFLTMFYRPSENSVLYTGSYRPLVGLHVSEAFQSVLHLSFDVRAGLLIRQIHHWAANVLIAAIAVHAARIFFTAAYRKPREINWLIGLTLLLLAIVNGFLGYSLCDDLLSGAGLQVGYSIVLSIPLIGPWISYLFLGGAAPTDATIPRMYALHIFLIPLLMLGLIALHITLIWRQKHTNYPGPQRTNTTIVGTRLWPSYAFKSLGLFMLISSVLAALGGLVQVDPVWAYGPYEPTAILSGAQPDWYLGWIEGAMRLFPNVHLKIGNFLLLPELFFPAVLLPGLLFATLYAYPFLANWFSSDSREHHVLRLPSQQPINTANGCALIIFLLILEIAGGG